MTSSARSASTEPLTSNPSHKRSDCSYTLPPEDITQTASALTGLQNVCFNVLRGHFLSWLIDSPSRSCKTGGRHTKQSVHIYSGGNIRNAGTWRNLFIDSDLVPLREDRARAFPARIYMHVLFCDGPLFAAALRQRLSFSHRSAGLHSSRSDTWTGGYKIWSRCCPAHPPADPGSF